MEWLTPTDIKIFDKVFEKDQFIPRNEKNWINGRKRKLIRTPMWKFMSGKKLKQGTAGYKLKELSYYYTHVKGIKHVCINLEKLYLGKKLHSNYTNSLKKLGLMDGNKISVFGHKLLRLMYHNNNEIKEQIYSKSEKIPDSTLMKLEFFIFLTIQYCREKNLYKNIQYDVYNNLHYFVSILSDSNKEGYKVSIDLQNENNLYLLQGINWTGYEMKRFLTLSVEEQKIFLKRFEKALLKISKDEVPNYKLYNPKNKKISAQERYEDYLKKKYYKNLFGYYKQNYQYDLRFRFKGSLISYFIFNSAVIKQNKIKLEPKPNLNALIPFKDLEIIFKICDLKEIYNLIYFNKDSKYMKNTIKFYFLDDIKKFDVNSLVIIETEEDFNERRINKGDKIIIINEKERAKSIEYSFEIKEIILSGNDVNVSLIKIKKINLEVLSKLI